MIAENTATLGGGLFINAAGPRLARCRLIGNSAGAGAGLCLRGGARALLTECAILDSPQGAATDCDAGSSVQAMRTHTRRQRRRQLDRLPGGTGAGPVHRAPPA